MPKEEPVHVRPKLLPQRPVLEMRGLLTAALVTGRAANSARRIDLMMTNCVLRIICEVVSAARQNE